MGNHAAVMTWAEQAAAVDSVAGFRNDLQAHLRTGIVHSGPDFFIMLRAVRRGALVEQLVNPWWQWDEAEADCWFIWLLAGSGSAALEFLLPRYGPKKWVAFQTKAEPKFLEFTKLKRLWPKVQIIPKRSSSKRSK